MICIENIIKAKDYQKIALELPQDGIPSFGDENEQFHLIDGYDDYYVSSYGRIIVRKNDGFYRVEPKDIKGRIVNLIKDGKEQSVRVDKLVSDEFLFPMMGKDRLIHKDGNEKNCRFDNLIFLSNEELRYIQNSRFRGTNHEHVERLQDRQKYSQFAQFGIAAIRKIRFYILHPNGKDTDTINVCAEWADKDNGFEVFKQWCWRNIYEYPAKKGEKLEFNRTILSYGAEKPYSPKTCCFAPKYIIDFLNDRRGITIGQTTRKGTPYRVTVMGKESRPLYSYNEAVDYYYNSKADCLSLIIDDELEKGYLPIRIINSLQKWVDGWKSGLYRSEAIENERKEAV